MLELDGGYAGGQFVRSALTLSVLTDTPIKIVNVRGSRPSLGLRPQHLTVLEVIGGVCHAAVEGASDGAETVTFKPGRLQGGEIEADIGTAGSITLLFDTLLPLSLRLDRPLIVHASGGTDVKWSPPMLTYRRVKLPFLRTLGVNAVVDVDQRGFYPVGGGEATLRLAPSTIDSVSLTERGDRVDACVYSMAAENLSDTDVAERQAEAAVTKLEAANWTVSKREISYIRTNSLGTACCIRANYQHSLAGFNALGEQGTPAEQVGTEAASNLASFEETNGAVDRHLADQLLVYLGVVGGTVTIPAITDHVETSLSLLSSFGAEIDIEEHERSATLSAENTVL